MYNLRVKYEISEIIDITTENMENTLPDRTLDVVSYEFNGSCIFC